MNASSVNPKRIAKARLKKNMSRADLAFAIRIATNGAIRATERSVTRWENREHAPSDGVVPAIAKATGQTIEFFYEDGDDDEDDAAAVSDHDDILAALAHALAPYQRAVKETA